MVLPSVTEPGRDSTPAATSKASTRVVLPPPEGPTRTTLRTSPGPFAVGAAPAPWEAFALSAITFLQFRRSPRSRCGTVCSGPHDACTQLFPQRPPNTRPPAGHNWGGPEPV